MSNFTGAKLEKANLRGTDLSEQCFHPGRR
jgi:uncharacterized protein YjbI with pentapeptide repeats